MIDFKKIKSFEKGQRDSFEEIVCQLASHDNPKQGSSFYRVEGSGGDGGLEAYWLLSW